MSTSLPGPSRYSDHSQEIADLRAFAKTAQPANAITARAAADLLEAHDATGISLDDWAGPRDLVNLALSRWTTTGTFTPNGV